MRLLSFIGLALVALATPQGYHAAIQHLDVFSIDVGAAKPQPNVNAKISTPASMNSISNCRSTIGFGWRIS